MQYNVSESKKLLVCKEVQMRSSLANQSVHKDLLCASRQACGEEHAGSMASRHAQGTPLAALCSRHSLSTAGTPVVRLGMGT